MVGRVRLGKGTGPFKVRWDPNLQPGGERRSSPVAGATLQAICCCSQVGLKDFAPFFVVGKQTTAQLQI